MLGDQVCPNRGPDEAVSPSGGDGHLLPSEMAICLNSVASARSASAAAVHSDVGRESRFELAWHREKLPCQAANTEAT